MSEILFQSDTRNNLLTEIREIFREELKEIKTQQDNHATLLTRKATADLLKVSYATLHNWEKNNVLVPRRTGGRVYYRQADIDAAMKTKVRYNRS